MARDLDNADSSVILTSLSFHTSRGSSISPYTTLFNALKRCSLANLQCEAFLSNPASKNQAAWRNLSSSLVLSTFGWRVHFPNAGKLLHAKSMLIDQKILYVGSGNFTHSAAHNNWECFIRTDSQSAIADYLLFIQQLKDAS